jgi:predicted secreted Zn-dependent protease
MEVIMKLVKTNKNTWRLFIDGVDGYELVNIDDIDDMIEDLSEISQQHWKDLTEKALKIINRGQL